MSFSKAELIAMLGIDPNAVSESEAKPTAPAEADWDGRFDDERLAESVLQLTDWDREQGRKAMGNARHDPTAMADFFAAAFQQVPEKTDGRCVDKRRAEFMDALLESPEYEALHGRTKGNVHAAKKAAQTFAEQFGFVPDEPEKEPEDAQSGVPMPASEADEAGRKAEVLAMAAAACEKADDEAEEMAEMCRGIGLEPGSDNEADMENIAATFERMRRDPTVRRIIELAGRYRRAAQAEQRQKKSHGYDDMVGIETAGDVARLVPSELGRLSDDELEMDVLRRIVEKQAMCREYEGVEKQAKGPVVACFDESGSMSGEPNANAKAFALSLAWIAKHQKRYCCLIGFSSGSVGSVLVLKPGKWDQEAVLKWLAHFYGGGTTPQVPCETLPAKYWSEIGAPKGKTDMFIVTDGMMNIRPEMERTFKAWKEREEVTMTLLVVGSTHAGSLERVADKTEFLNGVSLEGVRSHLAL